MKTEDNQTEKLTTEQIIARANNKVAEVQKSTAKIDSTKQDYRKIPLAPYYEMNSKGIVRNIKTGKAVTLKKGTSKFYLQVDENNTRKLFSPQELKDSLSATKPVKEEKPVKEKKAPKVKKSVPTTVDLKDLEPAKRQKVEAIVSLPVSNYVKSWKLHKLGYSNEDIALYTGVTKGSVSRDLWLVREGHRPMPA